MRKKLSLALLLVASAGFAQQTPKKPLDRVQVLGWLAGKVYSAYLAMLAQQRGIDFEPTQSYLQSLRAAGAEEVLLNGLQSANRVRTAKTTVELATEEAVLQHLARGIELSNKELRQQAEQEFRTAVKLDPQNGALRLALSFALLSEAKWDESTAETREAVRFQPDEPELHQKLSVHLMRIKRDFEGAIAEQREAVRLEPDYSERHYNLGSTFQNKGDLDAAVLEYREALRLQPDLVDAHYNLGNILASKGDLGSAIAEYREEIHLHPDHAMAHYQLGRTLGTKGDFDGAARELREVVRIQPDNIRMRLALALTLIYSHHPLQSALELFKVPAVWFFLGALIFLGITTVRYFRRKRRQHLRKMAYGETPATAATKPRMTVAWRSWLKWLCLTALGFAVGSGIANAIAQQMPESLRNVIGWSVNGACVGVVQWILLRREFRAAWQWVPASAIGWLVGTLLFVPGGAFLYALVAALTGGAKHFLSGPDNGAVVGGSVGLLQWFLLRREVTGAGWWVPVSALGWALAYLAPWAGPATLKGATALGMITGSLTGIVLVWLLRRPRRGIQERTVELESSRTRPSRR